MNESNLTKYHPVVIQIIELLKSNDLWFETFEHEEVRTSEDAAKLRHGYSLNQGAKALVVRVKISSTDKKFIMLIVPGNARFDTTKVKLLFGAKDIRFATENEISDITNAVQPGGVPPFGNLFNLESIVDSTLFENEKVVFNAGDRRFSIAMKSEDYKKLLNPRIESIIS